MKEKDYWEECISLGAEECGLRLSAEQIDCLAESVMSGHENYDMAFYTPPSSDRIYSIEKEYELKLKRLQTEFDAYRCNAESAVRQALKQPKHSSLSIGSDDQVTRYDGRSTVIQY